MRHGQPGLDGCSRLVGGMGGRRELVGIMWHEATQRVELTYLGGEPDLVIATHTVIATLAADIGLGPVESAPGTRRWARLPG